jgi:two-component system response regulator YesN
MLKIIVIDDEQHVRNLIKSLIPVDLGIQIVAEAADGMDGFELCCKYKPHIVITDVRMPEMDGLMLMAKLSQVLPNTKVIIVSGHDEFSYAQKAIHYGAVGYLLKPLEEKDLRQVLIKAIESIQQGLESRKQFEKMKQELMKLQNSLLPGANEDKETVLQSESPVIQKVIVFIQENYNRDISLDEIATKIYMNGAYISRLFKEKTGKGFNEFLTEVRINQAKILLEKPELKVNEIADMIGYRDVSHFISVFKKITGLTPNDYRNGL